MKKYLLILFLCLLPGMVQADDDCCVISNEELDLSIDCCICKATSHTFFTIRPLYQVGSPEYESLFHDRAQARQDGCGGALQITPFGSRSTARAHVATYFTPFCKAELTVKETPDAQTDVIATYFNIATTGGNFQSTIRLAPYQTVAGLGLSYKHIFAPTEAGREFWLGISSPLTRVRNSVGFLEKVTQSGVAPESTAQARAAGVVANMTEAFKQPSWCFGRIDCDEQEGVTRLADITVEVGYRSVNKEAYHIDTHVGALIPTGNRVNGVNVFEPIVGHNKHWGVTFGTNFGIEIWSKEADMTSIWMEFNIQSLYLFRNTQTRLVDLKLKPWSRYMRLYSDITQAQLAASTADPFLYTPGVNIFAREVFVSPGLHRSYNSALLFNKCGFQAELGYNFFARAAECIGLACPWQQGPALVALRGLGLTNSVEMINTNFGALNDTVVANYNQNLIKASDLDLESAAHPATITHTFYAAFGHRWDDRDYPLFAGAGLSYEFARENNLGLDRWTFWAKFGASF